MNLEVLSFLESVLGKSEKKTRENYAFHCPFCHHPKPKLEVDLDSYKYHCWVCNVGGHNLSSLFRRLGLDYTQYRDILSKIPTESVFIKEQNSSVNITSLPQEYHPLYIYKKDPEYKNALYYCKKRGITVEDIIKYQIGYCGEGKYGGRIIIPSFDKEGQVNYFVGRAYYDTMKIKYLNPPVQKETIIVFENLINWQLPVILVEGVFDALTVKRNAIPLLGKNISSLLLETLIKKQTPEVILFFDPDAVREMIKAGEMLIEYGINVKVVDWVEKDPADLGYKKCISLIKQAKLLSFDYLIQQKLSSI